MNPIGFFRFSLLLPILLPLVLLPFGVNTVFGVLLLSFWFGGAQYILFAVAMLFWLRNQINIERVRDISFISPLLFAPVQAIGWVIYCYIEKLSNPNLVGIWESIPVFVIYTLVVGYVYVGIVNFLYIILYKGERNAAKT